jgi:hypothetical protein
MVSSMKQNIFRRQEETMKISYNTQRCLEKYFKRVQNLQITCFSLCKKSPPPPPSRRRPHQPPFPWKESDFYTMWILGGFLVVPQTAKLLLYYYWMNYMPTHPYFCNLKILKVKVTFKQWVFSYENHLVYICIFKWAWNQSFEWLPQSINQDFLNVLVHCIYVTSIFFFFKWRTRM